MGRWRGGGSGGEGARGGVCTKAHEQLGFVVRVSGLGFQASALGLTVSKA